MPILRDAVLPLPRPRPWMPPPLGKRTVSRHSFLRGAAGTAALLLGGGAWRPAVARAAPAAAEPRAVPGGLVIGSQTFHVFDPVHGEEPSTITDFNGVVGVAHVTGTGTGTGGGGSGALTFDADMRFMQGEYLGLDGQRHRASFGFI